MNGKIELKPSAHELANQGRYTALENMHACIEAVDKTFGKDYSKNHPELIAGLVQAAAIDYHASLLSKHIEYIGEKMDDLNENLMSIASSLEDLR